MPNANEQIGERLSSSGSFIYDDRNVISYQECGKLVAAGKGNSGSSFNALALRNRLPEAVQVIDHIINRRSFLVLNGAGPVNQSKENITTFCRNVITASPGDHPNFDSIASFSLQSENQFHVPETDLSDTDESYLVLRTSGTTSEPKFVLHDQELVLRNGIRCAERLGLGADDKVLIPAPIYHSYGLVTAFLPSLMAGSSIRLMSNVNVINLVEAIRSFKPTVLFTTPGLVEMLLKINTNLVIPKLTVTAGDNIREELFIEYEKRIGTILNLYGSSEMGAMAISDKSRPVRERAGGYLEALPGIKFSIKSAGGQLGTILCQNDCGYLRYIDCCGRTVQQPGNNEWFDTKDLGETAGNEVKVFGRFDHKINRNGVLFSYFEIERAIEAACKELRKVVIVKLPDRDIRGTQFAAICELKENSNIDGSDIMQRCLKDLNRSMVPDAIAIRELPLLPNGKIDRKTLQEIYS